MTNLVAVSNPVVVCALLKANKETLQVARSKLGDMPVVAKISCSTERMEMIMSLCLSQPLVIWNDRLRSARCPVACVCRIGSCLGPETLGKTGVNEVGPNQVDDGKVNAFTFCAWASGGTRMC